MNNKIKKIYRSMVVNVVFLMPIYASEPVDWGDPLAVEYVVKRQPKSHKSTCPCALKECDGSRHLDDTAVLEKQGDEYIKHCLQVGCCSVATIVVACYAAGVYAWSDAEL